MDITKAFLALIVFLTVNIAGCASTQETLSAPPAKKHDVIIPPLKFVSPEDEKQWEGEINGRAITYYRIKKERGILNVVVSTQDNLPEYFKRIEYFDDGGDGILDLMSMKIYDKEKGWRDVGITKDNKYGITYADSQYKELLEKIREAETVKK
jgi:hypothetical protein